MFGKSKQFIFFNVLEIPEGFSSKLKKNKKISFPKVIHAPIPGTCEGYFIWKKKKRIYADVIK